MRVTIRHPEGYILSTLLIVGLLPILAPTARTLSLFEWAFSVIVGLFGLHGLYLAFSWEQLDENGVFLKRPFWKKQYSWEQVRIAALVPVLTARNGRAPQLRLVLADRMIRLRCTKESLETVRTYHGGIDNDLWGDGIPD